MSQAGRFNTNTPAPGTVLTLTGNSGGAVGPDGSGNINIIDDTSSGTSRIVGSPGTNTLTLEFTDAANNTGIGLDSLINLTTGTDNTALGFQALQKDADGTFNTAIGDIASANLASGNNTTSVGYGALTLATAGDYNTAIGSLALQALLTGTRNIALGFEAGQAYVGAETSNITLGNNGVAAESHVIRIGTTGGGAGQQNKAFIAGIDGVNVGSVAKVVTMASDQLGTATITAGTGISVTPGANTITISSSGTTTLTYTNVNTTPYVVLTTDEYLSVDSSGGAITVQLPNAATLGKVFIVKDRTGSAAASNITVTTVGGAVNIDGATTFVMNANFQVAEFIGNGSSYEVF